MSRNHDPEKLWRTSRQRSGDRGQALPQVGPILEIEGKTAESPKSLRDSSVTNVFRQLQGVSGPEIERKYWIAEPE